MYTRHVGLHPLMVPLNRSGQEILSPSTVQTITGNRTFLLQVDRIVSVTPIQSLSTAGCAMQRRCANL